MLEEFSLIGKAALVTGAGSPMGRAIVQALTEAGASVAAVSMDVSTIASTIDEISGSGRKIVAFSADVTEEIQVQTVVNRTMEAFGRIDILVNGEDADFGKPILETNLEEWRKVFDINVTSIFLCCKAVAPIMIEQGKGKIVNISSALSQRAVVNGAVYCASKGAISQLTQALALEWGPNQISINAVAPGWFADGPVDPLEDLKENRVRMIPQYRRGQPEDIAGLVVYLASEAGSYTTGQNILVDGGLHTHA
ncbi:SDR family NAD(P)-dependent oxidoreductase [Thermodesulfobacteriota bacterium]